MQAGNLPLSSPEAFLNQLDVSSMTPEEAARLLIPSDFAPINMPFSVEVQCIPRFPARTTTTQAYGAESCFHIASKAVPLSVMRKKAAQADPAMEMTYKRLKLDQVDRFSEAEVPGPRHIMEDAMLISSSSDSSSTDSDSSDSSSDDSEPDQERSSHHGSSKVSASGFLRDDLMDLDEPGEPLSETEGDNESSSSRPSASLRSIMESGRLMGSTAGSAGWIVPPPLSLPFLGDPFALSSVKPSPSGISPSATAGAPGSPWTSTTPAKRSKNLKLRPGLKEVENSLTTEGRQSPQEYRRAVKEIAAQAASIFPYGLRDSYLAVYKDWKSKLAAEHSEGGYKYLESLAMELLLTFLFELTSWVPASQPEVPTVIASPPMLLKGLHVMKSILEDAIGHFNGPLTVQQYSEISGKCFFFYCYFP
jgi:hypothetical protein